MNKLFLIFFSVCIFSNSYSQTANSYYDSGSEKLKAGNYNEAIKDFTRCLEISPYFYEANVDRGRCYHALGKHKEAMNDYNEGLSKRKDYPVGLFYRGKLFAEQKEFKEALQDFTQLIELRPYYYDAYVERAFVYLESGQPMLALKDMDKAISIEKKDPLLLMKRGLIWVSLDSAKLAFNDFSAAIEMKKDFGEAYYHRGVILEKAGRWQVASEDYSNAIRYGYENREIYERRALMYENQKKWTEAKSDYDYLIITLGLKDSYIYNKRGLCLMETGDYALAIKDFNSVIARDRNNEDAIILRANCNIAIGKGQSAMNDYSRVLNMNPKNALALQSRGILYFDQKRYDLALEDLNKAIKIQPTAIAYFYRGAIKDMKNDTKGACSDLKSAADLGHEEAKKLHDKICQ